jgi:hypothetical protein
LNPRSDTISVAQPVRINANSVSCGRVLLKLLQKLLPGGIREQ